MYGGNGEFIQQGIPKRFAKRYLENEPYYEYRYTFHIDDDDGKTWEVYVVDDRTHVRFRKGQKDLVLENKLKVDDIYIFELISKQEIKVHILVVCCNCQLREIYQSNEPMSKSNGYVCMSVIQDLCANINLYIYFVYMYSVLGSYVSTAAIYFSRIFMYYGEFTINCLH